METLAKADIFFFITSIAVVVATIFLIALASYALHILRRIQRLCDRVEQGIDTASIEVRDMFDNIKESSIFQFLFSRSKSRKKRLK